MGIKRTFRQPVQKDNLLTEKLYREERNYRADRLVEKWSGVAEIGKGIQDMPANTARNLAILLENQTRAMSKMTEATLASTFNGYTPENMLRLIRLSYPNSIRGDLFTDFAMETAHDSVKYIEPVYAKSMPDGKMGNNTSGDIEERYNMAGKFDVGALGDVTYESAESQFATDRFSVSTTTTAATTLAFTVDGAYALGYVDGYGKVVVDGAVVAIQDAATKAWVGATLAVSGTTYTFTFTSALTADKAAKFTFAYNADADVAGKYLGEVELQMRSYTFEPKIVSLGVTWTQLTELILDTSFGVSAEEMLMDSAAQEIKKTLDYQAVKYAAAQQKFNGIADVTFNAEAAASNDDSYWHTAQLIGQAIDQVANKQLDEIGRGGVTAIVGGPKAITYLKLNKGWSDRGRQASIGGHKVGELDGIPCYKVPSAVIGGESKLITTWKNEAAEGDVAIAIGTLMPFYSTGALQRKNLYKEAAVASFQDMKALQPKYLGGITINNIR